MSEYTQNKPVKFDQNLSLVFLAGASGKIQFWHPVMQLLTAYPKTNLLVYPGFSGAPRHPKVNDFLSLQSYIINQITDPSVIIAQSMGGIFAVQAALEKPTQIRGLVLVATSGGLDLRPFHAKDWREAYLQDLDLPDWFAVTKSQGVAEALSSIRCPVLLIWGDNDPVSPVAVGQYLQQQLADAQLHVIAGGKHNLAKVHANQVSQLIGNFLAEISAE